MTQQKGGRTYFLSLSPGERIIETLMKFCRERMISSAAISCIGSCRGAEIGFYVWEKKTYKFKKLSGDHEIAALEGNVQTRNGKPRVHAHVVLGDKNYRCWAGHLKEAEVLAACELVLSLI